MFKHIICKLISIIITDNMLRYIAREKCGNLITETNNEVVRGIRLLEPVEIKHINNKRFVSFLSVNTRTDTFLDTLICDDGVISMNVHDTETYINDVKYSLYIKET